MPTISETVPGLQTVGWGAIAAPKGVDPRRLKVLADAINEATQTPEMRERFTRQGVESVFRSPEYLATMIRSEVDNWTKVVKAANVKVD